MDLEGVPTVNDRTRPPLDVEARKRLQAFVDASPEDRDDMALYEARSIADDVRALLAAYQPTGVRPDDLAGLLTEALADYWRERYGEGDVSADPENPRNIEAGRDLARYLTARGVTLTGVRSSEDKARLDAIYAAVDALWPAVYGTERPASPLRPEEFLMETVRAAVDRLGVRSSEVDGLRAAAQTLGIETVFSMDDWLRVLDPLFSLDISTRRKVAAALTRDTGPKVEPERKADLAKHVRYVHANEATGLNARDLLDYHEGEHQGPGTIRNHPADDYSYPATPEPSNGD